MTLKLRPLSCTIGEPVGNSPAEFGAFIKAETNRYAKVVRDAGVGAE